MRSYHLCSAIAGFLIASPAALGADCPVPNRSLHFEEFFKSEFSGRVAWLRNGPDSQRYYLLENCNKLLIGDNDTLYFTINTIFSPQAGDGTASFVAVQVARLQSVDQRVVDATIERNDKWCRELSATGQCLDGVPQYGFSQSPVGGLAPKAFSDLHDRVPFDDAVLKHNDLWWHATPNGSRTSSRDQARRLSWSLGLFSQQPTRTLLSNRLYGFAFGSTTYSEVPFEIRVRGTQTATLRVQSPLWPDDPAEYTLVLDRR
jgi:hypothetical protein